MAAALHADMGTMELTISSYLIGFSFGQLLWGPIGTDTAAACQWHSGSFCS